ncbi:glutamate--tRNA ligase [bacterium]|nr:glutamate--tRNA ligase [Candidatus Elulimicrobium humile]
MIKTRIAPSPTGNLHIGTARAALFSYLYAKNQQGKFVIRIEDTDIARSTKESEQDIIEGLEWLGLIPDEGVSSKGELGELGPYRQSQRADTYRPYLEQLLSTGDAYWCNLTEAELEKLKSQAEQEQRQFVLRSPYRDQKQDPTEKSVLRFKVPDTKVIFEDKIKGKIEFDTSLLGDFVIAKNLDYPLYNFVVVVDDELMEITHIIRGDDHIANTPKQILINKALGFKNKQFAHLPLILAPDKSKMSKRFGATSIREYREQGYLPEAMINFLALLGWNEGNDREYYTLGEIIAKFSLKRVQKSGAIFNIQKLDSINAHYIKQLRQEKQLELGREYLVKNGFELSQFTEKQLNQIINLEIQRIKKFADIGKYIDFFWRQPEYDTQILAYKSMQKLDIIASLEWSQKLLYNIKDTDLQNIEHIIKTYIQADNKQTGEILWPLRVSLSGREKSPSPFEIIAILGREESIKRIQYAEEILTK